MKKNPVIVENKYNSPVEVVWKAITDKDTMKSWYFDLAEFKAEPGFEFRFEGGTEETTYLHICKVQEVIPYKKLSYTWRYQGITGETLVSFELLSEVDGTTVILIHEGIETFPSGNPDLARNNFLAGWKEIMGVSLKKYLENSAKN
jgi:uncharacterized protein YndB with AHSA1/START domain